MRPSAFARGTRSIPSIGVTPNGKAVLAVTLSGPNYYPTAAYSVLSDGAFRSVRIAGAGVGPADGFTGYDPFVTDGVERWGDYSAMSIDPDGCTFWYTGEYYDAHPTTKAEANWLTRRLGFLNRWMA